MLRAITKAITYRLLGAAATFAVCALATGNLTIAGGMVGFELVGKTALYVAHERAWARIARVGDRTCEVD
jgi:uncharacterized membrane protein